jgi:cytochrome c-type biogenesis protein CcmH
MSLWITFAFMTAIGLWAVLTPFRRATSHASGAVDENMVVYRDQLSEIERELELGLISPDDAESAKAEISRRLLAAAAHHENSDTKTGDSRHVMSLRRSSAIMALIGIPAIGLGLYISSGSPNLPGQPFVSRMSAPASGQKITELIARAEAHLRSRPNDTQGWAVLAPAYIRQKRFSDAIYALEQVLKLEGRKPAVLVQYGEAVMYSEGGLITKKARDVFIEALSLDKKLVKPRYYLGTAAAQGGKTNEALSIWQAMLQDAPQQAPWRPLVERAVKAAQARIAKGPNTAKAPTLDQATINSVKTAPPKQQQEMINAMVQRLATRLETNGKDLQGWLRLMRSYSVLQRKTEAQAALKRARAIFSGDEKSLGALEKMATQLKLTQ